MCTFISKKDHVVKNTLQYLHAGAFMIPYLVMLFLLGIPLFYLELLLGQSLRKGPVLTWHKLLPNFTGVGIASVVVIVYICLYYNVIIAWVIFYFFNSFQSPLPWAKCDGFDVLKKDLSDVLVNYTGNVGELESCFNESTEYVFGCLLLMCTVQQLQTRKY